VWKANLILKERAARERQARILTRKHPAVQPADLQGEGAGLLIRNHDHFTPAREMRRDVRALTARNHPKGRFYPAGPTPDLLKRGIVKKEQGVYWERRVE